MSDCIECTGPRGKRGYGSTKVTVGPRVRYALFAHRVAWEQAHQQTIPEGMVIRHTCDNSGCVNAEHLLVGTPADNVRDRDERGRHGSTGRTHCPKGHEYTPENTYIRTEGWRACCTCQRDAGHRYRAKKKEQSNV